MLRGFIALTSLVVSCGASVGLAQSADDLLDRAVRERRAPTTGPAEPKETAQLVTKADQLVSLKKFDEALELYEKAYRLSPTNQNNYYKMLVARRAAGRMTDTDREAIKLLEADGAMRIEQIIGLIRLDILQARDALAANDGELASSKVEHARSVMARLPKDTDVTIYRHELDRLATSAKVRIKRQRAEEPAAPRATPANEPLRMSDTGEKEDPRAGTAMVGKAASQPSYEPEGQIIDPNETIMPDDPSYTYQIDMHRAITSARAERFFGGEAAKVAPPSDSLNYPEDWAKRTANRSRYRDGEVYRGPTFKTADGQDAYTAIYELGDLVRPVPHYTGPYHTGYYDLDMRLDREALRSRSMIFGGWAEDFAAGLPLVQYYGGNTDWAAQPRYDPRELERVLGVIDRFVANQNRAKPGANSTQAAPH